MEQSTPLLEEIPAQDSCAKAAMNLACGLTSQFITLAIGGIGFAAGLAYALPTTISTAALWLTLGIFGASVVFGLLFFMHGISQINDHKSYDVYAGGLRIMAGLQILLVLLGVIFLCLLLNTSVKRHSTDKIIQISAGENSLTYPIDAAKNYKVEIDGNKVNVISSN
jgi:hypothetical protein